MKDSVRELLSHVIDYAGLFPPAELDMDAATRNYHGYRIGAHRWMLGRFIVSASRLEEFNFSALELIEKGREGGPWRLSALAGPDIDSEIERIQRFNRWHADRRENGSASIDVVEIKASSADVIEAAGQVIPHSLRTYFEVPLDEDLDAMVRAISLLNAGAKVRTGGLTPEMTPGSSDLARFIAACQVRDVPFKATAGLHHPISSVHRLTYEPGGGVGKLYGFLNVFLAAAFVRDAVSEAEVIEVLNEESAGEFVFGDDGVRWHSRFLSNEILRAVRDRFATSFGSCSFDEPIEGLRGLGLL